jgi:hypothetical protein
MSASSTGVAVTGLQVLLRQLSGAFPDPVGHRFVVDLLTERNDVVDSVACHESQGRFPGSSDVVGILGALQPECHLAKRDLGQVRGAEHLAGGKAAREVVKRCAAHQRVVDIEEGGGGQVRDERRCVSPGGRRPGIHRCVVQAGLAAHDYQATGDLAAV